MAGLAENKANSANPAELELGLSWAELGNNPLNKYWYGKMHVLHNNIITFAPIFGK